MKKRILLLAAMFVLATLAVYAGQCPQPTGTDLQDKWECDNNVWTRDKGSGVTVTGTCELATWVSEIEVIAVAKGGQECFEYAAATSGTLDASDVGSHDLSNVTYWKPSSTAVTLSSFRARSLSWWQRLWLWLIQEVR